MGSRAMSSLRRRQARPFRASARRLLRLSMCVCGAIAAIGFVVASGALAAGPRITSVAFTGNQAHPTITIRGQGLGELPSPRPSYHPLGHPLCPPKPTLPLARYGFNYGVRLYLEDFTQHWSAGRYRPSLNELDCIGVIATAFNPTHIVIHLGAAYPRLKTTTGATATSA